MEGGQVHISICLLSQVQMNNTIMIRISSKATNVLVVSAAPYYAHIFY